MEKFTLELLIHLIGIGSASGLIFKKNSLFIISDNSNYLYQYHLDSKIMDRIPLMENPSENIAKKDKSDFEAITSFQDTLYVFGSGSTPQRNKLIEINTYAKEISQQKLDDLYAVMRQFGEISTEDFNIEGAVYTGKEWYLFNRGNGKSGKNIVFTIGGKNLINEYSIMTNDYKLPKIKGVRSSFTDAVYVEGKIYFLATAENTTSTYDDGQIMGSFIGCIDTATMKITFTKKISSSHKFEGLSLYNSTADSIEFLLCEDSDSQIQETNIYKLHLAQ